MDAISPEGKLLVKVARAAARTKKLEMLEHYKRSSKLKNIFLYAFDPFRKYYVRKFPPYEARKDHLGTYMGEDTWYLLDLIAKREITGTAAKDALVAHAESLQAGEANLFTLIVLKKLRVGISEASINKIWEGLIASSDVMKAEDWSPAHFKQNSLVSVKIDCIRARYKDGIFTTRSGHTISGLNHIDRFLKSRIPGGGQWDGELVVPEYYRDFNKSSGYLRAKTDHKPRAAYMIFDCPMLAQLPLSLRLQEAAKILPFVDPIRPGSMPVAGLVPHSSIVLAQQVLDLRDKVVAAGGEGVMVKDPRSRYRPGRSYAWMKVKKFDDAEFLIVDVVPGEGKYSNAIGALVVDVSGVKVNVGTGLTDQFRFSYWAHPEEIVGRYATIEFMERTKDGSLREPRFKTIRWDI